MAYDSGPSATELAKVDAENLDEEVKNIMKSIDKSIMTFDSAIIDTAPILPPAPTPKNPGIMEKLKGLYSKRDRSKRQIKRTPTIRDPLQPSWWPWAPKQSPPPAAPRAPGKQVTTQSMPTPPAAPPAASDRTRPR